jgi:hypothetical protein
MLCHPVSYIGGPCLTVPRVCNRATEVNFYDLKVKAVTQHTRQNCHAVYTFPYLF